MADPRASSDSIETNRSDFRRRFLAISLGVGAVVLLAAGAILALIPQLRPVVGFLGGGGLGFVALSLLLRRGAIVLATHGLLLLAVAIVAVSSALVALPTSPSGAVVGMVMVVTIAAVLTDTRTLVAYVALGIAVPAATAARVVAEGVLPSDLAWSAVGTGSTVCVLIAVTLSAFVRHHERGLVLLETRMREIDQVMASARRIADGDLAEHVEGDSQVSEAMRGMIVNLRHVVGQIRGNVAALTSAATQIAALARTQQQGAVAQASAAEEVNATLGIVREGSQRVANATDQVFDAITQTERSSELAVQRLAVLAAQAQRIDEIAKMIQDIAAKSEVLALNAALEGVRAGAEGRGFSLVAAEMQALATRVTEAVKDVQRLTGDIDAATQDTVEATREGAERASGATEVARQIRVESRQQLHGAEQAVGAMEDVTRASAETSTSSKETLQVAASLEELAQSLAALVAEFRLES
ncbi:MAG: methyl-accepting chemotaxis protein [Myxococcota bacterium]